MAGSEVVLPAEDILSEVALQIGDISRITPYQSEQRHSSWKLVTNGGEYWLKVELHGNEFASLSNEITALSTMMSAVVPTLVRAGKAKNRPYLLTKHREGTPLDELNNLGQKDLEAVLASLAAAQLCSVDTAVQHELEPASVYSFNPDPVRCVANVASTGSATPWVLNDLVNWVSGLTLPAGDLVRVHGSTDPSNVLISERGEVTLLDWEATRLGPAEIDLAALIHGLLTLDRPDLARTVLSLRRTYATAGFLILRLLYLHANDVLVPSLLDSSAELIRSVCSAS